MSTMASIQNTAILASSLAAETTTTSYAMTTSSITYNVSRSSMYPNSGSLCRQQPASRLSSNATISTNKLLNNNLISDKKLVRTSVQAKQVKFNAKRAVTIPFREGAFPADDYLKETERIVQVTFPDSTRIEYLGDQKWRSRLRPITFISVSATPTVEMRVTFEKGALRLHSNNLSLDFSGVPDDFAVADFSFTLNGSMRAIPRLSQFNPARRSCDFSGSVSLGLATELPLAFALIPEGIVTRVGDEILDRIIGAMEGALLQGIITDYNTWCRMKSKKLAVKAPPTAVPLRTSTS